MLPLQTQGLWANITDLDKPSSPNAMEALQSASYMLWVLSGRRWGGVRTSTEQHVCRYGTACCSGSCMVPKDMLYASERFAEFGWLGLWDDEPARGMLFLRNRPVREIVSISRDGEPLDISRFAVYDRAYLGSSGSGCCDDPCFDPCCFEVTYTWGSPPPPMGRTAAIDLANEFVKSIECPDECMLPQRISSVSRQGVNMQVFDTQDFLSDGRMGVYSVDVFLKAVNPMRAQKRARVFSPDMPSPRRRTWQGGGGARW